MSSPLLTQIRGAKGGVGTSTYACTLALLAARNNLRPLLYHHDDSVPAIINSFSEQTEAHGITLTTDLDEVKEATGLDSPYGSVIVDLDRKYTGELGPIGGLAGCTQICCITNDYVALRMYLGINGRDLYDSVVCLFEERRALREADIRAVIETNVIFVPRTHSMMRIIDAGLFASRFDRLTHA